MSIRNIHDAIDSLTDEALNKVRDAKDSAITEAQPRIEDSLGITQAKKLLKEAADESVRLSNYTGRYSGSINPALSPFHKAMREVSAPFQVKLDRIEAAGRDAHIRVVTGDKLEIINQLRTILQGI